MRFLVTGASGFVGARLVRRLRHEGHRVAGIYIGEPPPWEGVQLLEADVLDREALERAVEAAAPEAVVHLAGLSHVGESWSSPGEYFRVNVLGTENLLATAGDARVVLASSAEVYGPVPEEEQPLREERLPDPRSPYGLTKAAAERLVLAAGGVVVRSFNLVGPGQVPRFALPCFARQLATLAGSGGPPVLEVGNLEARRDFLHVEDGVSGYLRVALEGAPGGVYNLGSGRAWSIREALDLLCGIAAMEVEIRVDPERVRPVDVPCLRAETSRLEALGWSPERSLEEALRELWESVRGGDAAAG